MNGNLGRKRPYARKRDREYIPRTMAYDLASYFVNLSASGFKRGAIGSLYDTLPNPNRYGGAFAYDFLLELLDNSQLSPMADSTLESDELNSDVRAGLYDGRLDEATKRKIAGRVRAFPGIFFIAAHAIALTAFPKRTRAVSGEVYRFIQSRAVYFGGHGKAWNSGAKSDDFQKLVRNSCYDFQKEIRSKSPNDFCLRSAHVMSRHVVFFPSLWNTLVKARIKDSDSMDPRNYRVMTWAESIPTRAHLAGIPPLTESEIKAIWEKYPRSMEKRILKTARVLLSPARRRDNTASPLHTEILRRIAEMRANTQ